MTWRNHRIVTFSVIYVLTGNVLWSILAAAGSTIPDHIEFLMYKTPSKWQHRKWTHWFVPYLMLAIVGLIIAYYSKVLLWSKTLQLTHLSSLDQIISNINITWWGWVGLVSAWLAIGAICHVLEDAITGTVPGLNPKKRSFGIKWFETGSGKENIFVIAWICLFVVKLGFDLNMYKVLF